MSFTLPICHHHFECINSTNTELCSAIKTQALSAKDSQLFTADTQTNGRGQYDRQWQSPQGNVYLSLYLPINQHHLHRLTGALSLCVGLALWQMPLIQTLNKQRQKKHLAPILVKWSNDLGVYLPDGLPDHPNNPNHSDISHSDVRHLNNSGHLNNSSHLNHSSDLNHLASFGSINHPSSQSQQPNQRLTHRLSNDNKHRFNHPLLATPAFATPPLNARPPKPALIVMPFYKLAGILIEPVTIANQSVGVVIGVGLNVNHTPVLSDGYYQAISLNDLGGTFTSADSLYTPITDALLTACHYHNQHSDNVLHGIKLSDDFCQTFNNAHALHGKLTGIYPQSEHHPNLIGTCTGIGSDGTLTLASSDGIHTAFAGMAKWLVAQ